MTRVAASRSHNWAVADPGLACPPRTRPGIAYGDSPSLAAQTRGPARRTALIQAGQRPAAVDDRRAPSQHRPNNAGDEAIQPATDPVAAGLITSGIALRLAQINWFCSRPGDKGNNP